MGRLRCTDVHGSHLPAPLPVCVLAVCVGCVCVACPRSACRRVGVSACVLVCRLVCWCVGSQVPISQFFSKKCLYTEGHHHTQVVLSRGMMDFLLGGFGRFFCVFSGYDARACPAWPSNPPRLRRRTPPARAEIVEPAWPAWSARAVFIEPAWPAWSARAVFIEPAWSARAVFIEPAWPRLKRSPA